MTKNEQRAFVEGVLKGLKLRLSQFDPLVDKLQEALLIFHNDHYPLPADFVDELMSEARKMGVVCQPVARKTPARKSNGASARQLRWLQQ